MRSDGFDLFQFKPQGSLMAGKDGVVTFGQELLDSANY